MTEYKTPGVYVKEISKFPPSVAGVATAIPAFIGFTQKPEHKDNDKPQAVRINSLLDYENLFGAGPELELDDAGKKLQKHNFVLYDSIRLFYDNGGGTCYVVSVGDYKTAAFEAKQYTDGLEPLKKVDEVTLLVAPDAAMLLDKEQLGTVHKAMLTQCVELGDRFAILDPKKTDDLNTALKDFREYVGSNGLSYGAAYYPYLKTSYTKDISFDEMLKIADIKEKAEKIDLYNNYYAKTNNEIKLEAWKKADFNSAKIAALRAMADAEGIEEDKKKKLEAEIEERNKYTFDNNAIILLYNNMPITLEDFFKGKEKDYELYNKIQALINSNKETIKDSEFSIKEGKLLYKGKTIKDDELSPEDKLKKEELQKTINEIDALIKDTSFTIVKGNLTYDGETIAFPEFTEETKKIYNTILSEIDNVIPEIEIKNKKDLMAKAFAAQIDGYAEKLAELQDEASIITPSSAIAGIYVATDGNKGVWQAPANMGLASIAGVTEIVSDKDQEGMNVDPNAGKSVNAIRFFTGKGILVWGARTLDGNSNEWRYISVRRLFNYVEESVQKSTNWAVFQPNDANTWVKIQCQIENFLNNLWRDGALAGSTPEKAYYVRVGLDVTMTTDDINNGYLIVEIGIAAVRPAEFIVLKFSHKVQEA